MKIPSCPIYTYHFPDGKTLTVGRRTLVMGILNVTPDSFSDGGRYDTAETALAHMREMVDGGADLIDVGAESTRPGSAALTPEEEQARLLPLLEKLLPACPVPISVDTYHAATAEKAMQMGAHILNDIWGLQYAGEREGAMAEVAARTHRPVIVMHNQQGKSYDGDVIAAMQAFFQKSLAIAHAAGVQDADILLDPGIGFGKDTETNLLVQRRLEELLTANGVRYPMLFASSRKRFIGDTLGLPVDERMEATGASCVVAITKGADMVRVHDVRPIARMCRMTDFILGREKYAENK
ncbi:MAG: dihydropteroate synthase [Selenomonas sp.]|uniref:dihydropteroate synthase n=1 Tax=Selenomonas sp. TaxID=2053611 RepID=UPI0025DD939B|nr:dihydropteroate synthase [Selenomonas sp.]MCI6232690.1 dihydropteroate synthase [Selenomonas sp.]